MDEKYVTTELTDADLGAVAAAGNVNFADQTTGDGLINLNLQAAGQTSFTFNNTVIIDQSNNNRITVGAIEGAVIDEINITNSGDEIVVGITNPEDKIVVGVAGQDPVIDDIAFDFDDSGVHMDLTGFNGAGVDGGHVITFQGGANDVAVAEHDGHTTLSYGDFVELTVDDVGLVEGRDYWVL
jgi:hypothetical protein